MYICFLLSKFYIYKLQEFKNSLAIQLYYSL